MKAMLLSIAFGLGLIISLSFCGCGRDQNTRDDIPPSKPVIVPRSADDVLAQQGIRAEPVQRDVLHWVRLEWYPNPEGDVTGYRMYRTAEFDPPLQHVIIADLRVGIDLPSDASIYSWIDKGDDENGYPMDMLAPDSVGLSRGYYWEVLAYDEAGNRSQISDRVYYRLIANPSNVRVGRAQANLYSLAWQYAPNDPSDVPIYAMIRVFSQFFGPDSIIWYQRIPVYGGDESVSMTLNPSTPGLHADCTYIAQVNVISIHPLNPEEHTDALSGAAAYTTFVYQN
jgi:hypothetical protein